MPNLTRFALLAAWLVAGGLDPATALATAPSLADTRATGLERTGTVDLRILPPDEPTRPSAASPYGPYEGRLSSLEERLFADAADGRWDQHSLLTAALIASGVDRVERLEYYEARVAELVDELRRSDLMSGTPRRQAQEVLEFLHRRVLTAGYRLDATDLTRTLDQGSYNCVSATVLYNCLAQQCGLAVSGLETTGHAMSRLRQDEGDLDIETTCRDWFRLMDDPRKRAEIQAKVAASTRPQNGPAPAVRLVSDVELVAAIYYNRGVDLLGQKRFSEALAANAKALRLDPANPVAHGNLLATLNNWAIALGQGGRHAEAADLLRQGLALDRTYTTFHANYLHVHREWVEKLCASAQFSEALRVLSEAARVQPHEPYFRQAQGEVQRRWTESRRAAGQP